MLKMLPKEEGPYELEINKLFSTEPFSNLRNHCVPLLDVLNSLMIAQLLSTHCYVHFTTLRFKRMENS